MPYHVLQLPNAEGVDEAQGGGAAAGRVEDWRAGIRVRWVSQSFRHGPQSGSHRYVYSPRRLKPDRRISRIRLSDKVSCVRPRKITGTHLQPG